MSNLGPFSFFNFYNFSNFLHDNRAALPRGVSRAEKTCPRGEWPHWEGLPPAALACTELEQTPQDNNTLLRVSTLGPFSFFLTLQFFKLSFLHWKLRFLSQTYFLK